MKRYVVNIGLKHMSSYGHKNSEDYFQDMIKSFNNQLINVDNDKENFIFIRDYDTSHVTVIML